MLCRYERAGRVRPGWLTDGTIHPLEGRFSEHLGPLAAGNPPADERREDETVPVADVTALPPVPETGTVFGAALNYASHVEEKSGTEETAGRSRSIPETPYFFSILNRALVGHDEPIVPPTSATDSFDFAGELGVVIGEPAYDVSPQNALEYVAGYTVVNDTTAYDLQNVGVGDDVWIDWLSAKSTPSTTPVGPGVVPATAVDDPHDLAIRSFHNGERMQNGSTESMVRGVTEQIAFLSERVGLEPGDVIATGTPAGVGAFQDVTLAPGDEVVVEIEAVGTLRNRLEDQ